MRSGIVLKAVLHAPQSGWDHEAFERLTDAIAAALVSAFRRREDIGEKAESSRGRTADVNPSNPDPVGADEGLSA
jgi:hypothetical protein